MQDDEDFYRRVRVARATLQGELGDVPHRLSDNDWADVRVALTGLAGDLDKLGWPPPPADPPRAWRDLGLLNDLLSSRSVEVSAFDEQFRRDQMRATAAKIEAVMGVVRAQAGGAAALVKLVADEASALLGKAALLYVGLEGVVGPPDRPEVRLLLFASCVVARGLGRTLQVFISRDSLNTGATIADDYGPHL